MPSREYTNQSRAALISALRQESKSHQTGHKSELEKELRELDLKNTIRQRLSKETRASADDFLNDLIRKAVK